MTPPKPVRTETHNTVKPGQTRKLLTAHKRPPKHGPGHPLPAPGIVNPPHHKGKRGRNFDKRAFIWAEGQQESGGNYSAENADSGALGRWQVMPSNLATWLPESGYKDMSPGAFLANHKAQDAVAWTILGGYYDTYGPRGAAAEWYSGQPDPNKTYGDPPVYQYVDDVIALMDQYTGQSIPASGSSVPMPWALPRVEKTDTWSGQVRNSATELARASKAATAHATLIRNTYRK
jgi:hypothetical protein